jgi:hypothetical protein
MSEFPRNYVTNIIPCECSRTKGSKACECPMPESNKSHCYCFSLIAYHPCDCYPDVLLEFKRISDMSNSIRYMNRCTCGAMVKGNHFECQGRRYLNPTFLDIWDKFESPLKLVGHREGVFGYFSEFEGSGAYDGTFFCNTKECNFIVSNEVLKNEEAFQLMRKMKKEKCQVWIYNINAYFLFELKVFVSPDSIDDILFNNANVLLPGWYDNVEKYPTLRIVLHFDLYNTWQRSWLEYHPLMDIPVISFQKYLDPPK